MTDDWLSRGVLDLAERVPEFGALCQRNGVPPRWSREPGFVSLTHIILEQQVSLASARAAFDRLGERLGGTITPDGFLSLDDVALRQIGFSRQKAGYVRGLAAALADGAVDLGAIGGLPDQEAHDELVAIRGVGPWTASVYLMFALDRSDVWPPGDRALHVSMGRVFALSAAPATDAATQMAQEWRPWRSAAARLLWHEYLGGPDVVPA